MKHIIITRCKFDDDSVFQKYFTIMQKTYIPSINAQTDKNFMIGLVVNEQHYDSIRKEIEPSIKIVPFYNEKMVSFYMLPTRGGGYKNYVISNNINIQTRHDCDDIMEKDYIKYIHQLYKENKNKYDDFILTFFPTKLDIVTSKEYEYTDKNCTMFSTLIQKKVRHSIMDVKHAWLPQITPNVIYIKERYVKLVVHENNSYSKIYPNDVLIATD